nr:hypothetical protein CFP56_00936 [Quercus suber]
MEEVHAVALRGVASHPRLSSAISRDILAVCRHISNTASDLREISVDRYSNVTQNCRPKLCTGSRHSSDARYSGQESIKQGSPQRHS